ncbi:PTI1-like tyrosine-protein kinase 2 [Neltuma alba]|uniref:PTI1-like tyrosine-protein kinase 2 n=1 Tax=Neltuma alba TaxID=207710 RepID=UPI0010A56097|nr:PTI1-like tyrosine-protein kinase 2 [Prosopis alba]
MCCFVYMESEKEQKDERKRQPLCTTTPTRRCRHETIDWETRMKIAIGSAKGLRYLHEGCKPKIIHPDIKSANVLLLDDFQPKVGLSCYYTITKAVFG